MNLNGARTDGRSAGSEPNDIPMPSRFVDLKRQLVPPEDPQAVRRVTDAWNDVLKRLQAEVEVIKTDGSNVRLCTSQYSGSLAALIASSTP